MLVSVLLLLVATVLATRTQLWSSQLLARPGRPLTSAASWRSCACFVLLVITGAAVATIALSRWQPAPAVSAAGLGVAVLFVLEPAPDVALVQIVVDVLSMVILVWR